MDSKEWNKIKELFSTALCLTDGERVSFLSGVEVGLRREVEKLLANYAAAEDFIAEPAAVGFGFKDDSDDKFIGTKIDDYLILEEIGTGGMGAVYLAEQQEENLSHRVALKLIKRGMDTSSVLKRFVMERQILANLEHPAIARFLDGGSTPDGLPYFVMEYIEGRTITRYCDEANLDINARLQLFQKVAAAVSFAHQNLVVHRDLKPSNILVTADGEPKLLDFGIAKILNPDWAVDTAEATATMFRVMTPEYASPEQLRGLPVTTASDVYSLGVVLYELLTGERPYKIESRLPDEIAREILTREPVRPSSLLSRQTASGTGRENGEATKLRYERLKSLRGDLDNIILKALQNEPSRRFASVQEFSEDIRRHLKGLPVSASADTISYRMAKFIKRHKAGAVAAAAIVTTLITATGVTAWQARRANIERARAEQRFNDVRKLTNSLMFEFHDAIKELPGSTSARALVVKKALEYLETLAAENSGDPSLNFELAVAYGKVAEIQGSYAGTNLGDTQGALENYTKAIIILDGLIAAEPVNVRFLSQQAAALLETTFIYAQRGDRDDLADAFRRTIDRCETLLSIDANDKFAIATLIDIYKNMGDLTSSNGDLAGAIKLYRKSSDLAQQGINENPNDDLAVGRKMGPDEAIAATMGNPNYSNLGDSRGALEIYQRLDSLAKARMDAKPSDATLTGNYVYIVQSLGLVQGSMGDWPTAIKSYERALAAQRSLALSDGDNETAKWRLANLLTDFAHALAKVRRVTESLHHHRESIGILEQSFERDKENSALGAFLARANQRFGDSLLAAGQTEAANSHYEKAVASDQAMADEDKENMDIRWALGDDYAKLSRAKLQLYLQAPQKYPLNEICGLFMSSRSVYEDMLGNGLNIKPVADAIQRLNGEIAQCDQMSATR